MWIRFHFLLLLLIIIVSPPFVFAYDSNIDVSIEDRVYDDLEELESYGLIENLIHGQRPYSKKEIRFYINQVKKKLEALSIAHKSRVLFLLQKIEKRIGKDITKSLNISSINQSFVSFSYNNEDRRAVFANNGTGLVDAYTFRFGDFKNGRHYSKGFQYAIETNHSLDVTKYVSFSVTPRFSHEFEQPGTGANVFVQELYGVFNFWNLELSVGRSQLISGQGRNGGLLMSNNARPLDHIHLKNDVPFKLPGFLKHLGWQKIMAYWANLGPEYSFSKAHLLGYKWIMKPARWLELGLTNSVIIGGKGAPNLIVSDFILDFIGLTDTPGRTSNRLLSFDGRVTLPFLRNSQFYFEVGMEDKTLKSFKRTFGDSTAYQVGFYIPRITRNGKLSGGVEYTFVSELFYRHNQYIDGYTLNKHIIGDALGPDAFRVKFYLDVEIDNKTQLKNSIQVEVADSDIYTITPSGDRVYSINNGAKEKRYLIGSTLIHELNENFWVEIALSYENIQGFNFAPGNDHHNFFLEGKLYFSGL